MLPSLFAAGRSAQAWSLTRAAAYGAGIGALAALFKTIGPHGAGVLASLREIAAAGLAFALLCAGAAGLRNFIAQRLD